MLRARSWFLTIAARARSGSACGPVMRPRIRRTTLCRSAPGQDGEGPVDGAADGATDGAAGDADAAVEAAGEPLAPAEDDGPAEGGAAGLSTGVGSGVGFGVRNPPRPPKSPNKRIAAKITVVAMTKYCDGRSFILTARSPGVRGRAAGVVAPRRRRLLVAAAAPAAATSAGVAPLASASASASSAAASASASTAAASASASSTAASSTGAASRAPSSASMSASSAVVSGSMGSAGSAGASSGVPSGRSVIRSCLSWRPARSGAARAPVYRRHRAPVRSCVPDRRHEQTGQSGPDGHQPEDRHDRRGPDDLPEHRPEGHRDRHRPEDQGEPEPDDPPHQLRRRALLEQRLARDDEHHVGDPLPEREPDRDAQIPREREQEDQEAPQGIPGDDHPALREPGTDQSDDEPTDEVAEPEPGLEESIRRLPPERRVVEVRLREARCQRDDDAKRELAHCALERVREQDRLVAEEGPAGSELGADGRAVVGVGQAAVLGLARSRGGGAHDD